MENQQSNSGRSSGFTFLRAPSHFLFSKTRKQWPIAQSVITTTRRHCQNKRHTAAGLHGILTRFPFHTSASTPMGGHLRDRVSPAKVIMKKNKAKGFDGFFWRFLAGYLVVLKISLQGVSTNELSLFNGEKCTAPCLQGVSTTFYTSYLFRNSLLCNRPSADCNMVSRNA